MPKKPKTLTNREIKLLCLLAEGKTYEHIRQYFDPPISIANVHTSAHGIRRKTGIRQTRDAEECARYVSQLPRQQIERATSPTAPADGLLTDNQLTIFRLMALGRTYRQIAASLGINLQSVQNLASRACKRAGITHRGWDRTQAISKWVAQNDPDLPAYLDPMSDPAF